MARLKIEEVKILEPDKVRLVVEILATEEDLTSLKKKGEELRSLVEKEKKEMSFTISSLIPRLTLFVFYVDCWSSRKESVGKTIMEIAEKQGIQIRI